MLKLCLVCLLKESGGVTLSLADMVYVNIHLSSMYTVKLMVSGMGTFTATIRVEESKPIPLA